MRRAFFLAYDDSLCEYLMPDEVMEKLDAGRDVVSATFVTPYPPGFPVLVPGQVFSGEILRLHGRARRTARSTATGPSSGFRVFTDAALARVAEATAARAALAVAGRAAFPIERDGAAKPADAAPVPSETRTES